MLYVVQCGTTAKSLACQILNLHNQRRINLYQNHENTQGYGRGDGATAYDNIRDTCNGLRAKRRVDAFALYLLTHP